MQALQVKNWDKFQARKDRSVRPQHIWIKLYRALLTDFKWISLSDSEQGHLVNIWLLAAEKNGIIQDTAEEIKIICHLTDSPNLIKFIELGFLLVVEYKDNKWLPVDSIDNQWLPVDSNGCLEEREEIDEIEEKREIEFEKESYPQADGKTKKQSTKKKTRAARSDSPLDFKKIEGLNLEAYRNWLDYRKKRSLAKYTTLGKAEALAELDFYEQMKCVQESIDSGYQGIWPKDWAAKLDRQNSQQGKNNNEYQPQEQRRPSPPTVAELKKQQAAAQRCEDLTRDQRGAIAEKRALEDDAAAVQRREAAKAYLGKLRSKEIFPDPVSEDGEATRLGVILKKAEQRLKE